MLFAEGLAMLASVFVLGVVFDIHSNLNFCYFITILRIKRGLLYFIYYLLTNYPVFSFLRKWGLAVKIQNI